MFDSGSLGARKFATHRRHRGLSELPCRAWSICHSIRHGIALVLARPLPMEVLQQARVNCLEFPVHSA